MSIQESQAGDGIDFLSKYHSISSKLKKRFLRKPNVAEASNQFESLAASCEQRELAQYAGWCWLAAARCQGSLGNCASEVSLLTRAGRQFLAANKKGRDVGCLSPSQEELQAAINAFNHALARCDGQEHLAVMSAGLATELALCLGAAAAHGEGLEYLGKAAHSHPTVRAIGMLASCHVKQGDYVSALNALTELVDMVERQQQQQQQQQQQTGGGARLVGSYRRALHRCEVSRVLLLLVLRPTPQRLAPSLAQLLEKYAWAEDSAVAVPDMSEDELLLLQSLVLACQSRDGPALLQLESELWPRLDLEQKELLRRLVRAHAED